MKFEDDLDAAADLGWEEESIDKLAASGLALGAFSEFRSLDPQTRRLVLRLLDTPQEADFEALAEHPASTALARWLLTLPAYINAAEDDE